MSINVIDIQRARYQRQHSSTATGPRRRWTARTVEAAAAAETGDPRVEIGTTNRAGAQGVKGFTEFLSPNFFLVHI